MSFPETAVLVVRVALSFSASMSRDRHHVAPKPFSRSHRGRARRARSPRAHTTGGDQPLTAHVLLSPAAIRLVGSMGDAPLPPGEGARLVTGAGPIVGWCSCLGHAVLSSAGRWPRAVTRPSLPGRGEIEKADRRRGLQWQGPRGICGSTRGRSPTAVGDDASAVDRQVRSVSTVGGAWPPNGVMLSPPPGRMFTIAPWTCLTGLMFGLLRMMRRLGPVRFIWLTPSSMTITCRASRSSRSSRSRSSPAILTACLPRQ